MVPSCCEGNSSLARGQEPNPAPSKSNTVASLAAQMVKNLPAMQETRVRSLGREDPLEKGTATHSSILAWRIPWTRSLAGCSPRGSQRDRSD